MSNRIFVEPMKDSRNEGNDAKSGGAHLGIGSTEYKERVMDLKNVSKEERKEFERDKSTYRQKMKTLDPKAGDAWHKSEAKEAEKWISDKHDRRAMKDDERLSTTERGSQDQIRKMIEAKKINDEARQRAVEPETLQDDKLVARRLPKNLEKIIYNGAERELGRDGQKAMDRCFDD